MRARACIECRCVGEIDPYVEQNLANLYFISQLSRQKSDVKDAEWITAFILKGLVRGSYVPEDRIQRLRQYDRRIFDLNGDIVYRLTKLDAALQRCNIRLSNYVSTTGCKSYNDVVDAIARWETSQDALLKCVHGRNVNNMMCKTFIIPFLTADWVQVGKST